MKMRFFAILLLVSFCVSDSDAQDWPRWRGANQDDKSIEENLLQSWPEDGPEQLWVFDKCGLGYAGFSIVDNKLFTMGLEDDTEFAQCLNATTGKLLWQTQLGDRYNNGWGDGPRSTPTVDGGHVYFMAAKGDLVCLTTKGKKVWSVSLVSDFGGQVPSWGYSESPLVDGDLVICTPGGEQGAILALNKKTGEQVWRSTQVTSVAHYSSLAVRETDNGKEYVQLLLDKVVAVSPKDGTVVWESDWPGTVAVIPSPVIADDKVYVTSGYGVGSKLLDLSSGEPQQVYYNKVMVNHHGGVVLNDDCVFGYSDRKGFVCQDFKTGEMLWNDKAIKKGAVAFADGRLYFIEEQSGDVILMEANREEWVQKGRFKLSPQTKRRKPRGRIWVHPVISNGKLYLRDQQFIHCYDVSEK